MAKKRKSTQNTASSTSAAPLEISEEEQWRIINETGILKDVNVPGKLMQRPKEKDVVTEDEDVAFADEIFDALLYLTPFSFLLLMMDMMVPAVPLLAVFIFYTTRHKRDRRMQFFLFMIANVAGPRLLWLLSLGSWKVNIKQCPPLITLWVYTIVQLDLGPASLNLLITGIYVLLKGLKPLL
ncbi:hypothetical protein ONZ45_g65 [Pleurotus djamor]|nr:hypothetical protein ONZ45_g65 [Pleurotus djamor]